MMTIIRSIPYSVSEFGPSNVFGTGNYYIQLDQGCVSRVPPTHPCCRPYVIADVSSSPRPRPPRVVCFFYLS